MTIEEHIKTTSLKPSQRLSINLAYTAQWSNDILLMALKPYDISLQQFNVLRILRGQKGKPANLSTLNDRMVTKASNTTRLVDKLLKKELVNRSTCPSNRRKIEITITEAGLSLLNELDKVVTQAENKITTQLDNNEIEQLNNLLNKLRTETKN
ncbi:transcription regulator, MarR family [Dokdonia sp. MED134]|uniref:MarR family winged helix-turn-helix transcriptional regulator n=1 Tax=Dokdonia sp. MED134 TaxID=313590 RepID=UPI000068B141|nr:MarR family transcriptional regulator [Dokdonia sp. MED134]EAQ37733.1 transcription regulator, MarR family [Dokdonia sp. MED134]